MKKFLILLFWLSVFIINPSLGLTHNNLSKAITTADSIATDVEINFKIPKGWAQIHKNTFVLKDYNKEFNFWEKSLNEGHMPWRFDPKNIAVTCLWSFGIKNGSPVDDFATELNEIKKDKIFSLHVDSTKYIIYVRSKRHIPIAYKLEIKKAKH